MRLGDWIVTWRRAISPRAKYRERDAVRMAELLPQPRLSSKSACAAAASSRARQDSARASSAAAILPYRRAAARPRRSHPRGSALPRHRPGAGDDAEVIKRAGDAARAIRSRWRARLSCIPGAGDLVIAAGPGDQPQELEALERLRALPGLVVPREPLPRASGPRGNRPDAMRHPAA